MPPLAVSIALENGSHSPLPESQHQVRGNPLQCHCIASAQVHRGGGGGGGGNS